MPFKYLLVGLKLERFIVDDDAIKIEKNCLNQFAVLAAPILKSKFSLITDFGSLFGAVVPFCLEVFYVQTLASLQRTCFLKAQLCVLFPE